MLLCQAHPGSEVVAVLAKQNSFLFLSPDFCSGKEWCRLGLKKVVGLACYFFLFAFSRKRQSLCGSGVVRKGSVLSLMLLLEPLTQLFNKAFINDGLFPFFEETINLLNKL